MYCTTIIIGNDINQYFGSMFREVIQEIRNLKLNKGDDKNNKGQKLCTDAKC